MKLCSISDVIIHNYVIKDISAISQTPIYRTLNVQSRNYNGFIIIEDGNCLYSWGNETVELQKGALIYLPFNSTHTLQVLSKDISFYRINFTVLDNSQEKMIFSESPMLLYPEIDNKTFEIVRNMTELFLNTTRNFKIHALLYELLDAIETKSLLDELSPVERLITYIDNNYSSKITSADLLNICHISSAQMYRTFKKETSLTPIEYQNKLRISKAKTLLKSDMCSIGYISEILGFDSIYYFSRIFKQITGLSPTEYKKKLNR